MTEDPRKLQEKAILGQPGWKNDGTRSPEGLAMLLPGASGEIHTHEEQGVWLEGEAEERQQEN